MKGQYSSSDIETYRYYVKVKSSSLMSFTMVALTLLTITLPISLHRSDSILLAAHLVLLLFMCLNFFFIKKYGNLLLAVFTIIIPSYTVLLYSLFIGTSDTVSWFYLFPVLSFFLIGKRVAFSINVIFLLSLLTVLFFRLSILPEGYFSMIIIGLVYTTITILSYIFEANREGIQNKLIENSMVDFLTGCWNRRCFNRDLEREIVSSNRYNKEFSLILLDIDYFKQVNDNYGHVVGDIVLREFTNALFQNLRFNDTLYRLGGDEFIILLPNTGFDGAKTLAERTVEYISSKKFSIVNHLTASAGVTQNTQQSTMEDLLNQADRSLYNAKNSGKNRIGWFNESKEKP